MIACLLKKITEMFNFTQWHTCLKECFDYLHTENLLLLRKSLTLPVNFLTVFLQGLCNIRVISFPLLYLFLPIIVLTRFHMVLNATLFQW